MLRISCSCGSVPMLYFRSKRVDAEAARDRRRSSRRRSPASRRRARRRAGSRLELLARHRRPAALAADRGHASPRSAATARPRACCVSVGDVAGRVHGDRQLGCAELRQRPLVEVDVRREARGLAADDRQHQREAVLRRAHDGLRAAADADPRAAGARSRSADRRAGRSARRASSPTRSPARSLEQLRRTARASPRTAARTVCRS